VKDVVITIPGVPIPLKRPRVTRDHTYDEQAEIKEDVYWTIKSLLPDKDKFYGSSAFSFFRGPVSLNFTFFMPIPKNTSKKKKAVLNEEATPHIKRPDLDNLIKFYCDVCTVVLYYDDSQVYNIKASKLYSEEPRTIIKATYGTQDNIIKGINDSGVKAKKTCGTTAQD
jgi:Holliday junction resolvase RusA-like endonuclease